MAYFPLSSYKILHFFRKTGTFINKMSERASIERIKQNAQVARESIDSLKNEVHTDKHIYKKCLINFVRF